MDDIASATRSMANLSVANDPKYILNPVTGRYVRRDGAVGAKVLAQQRTIIPAPKEFVDRQIILQTDRNKKKLDSIKHHLENGEYDEAEKLILTLPLRSAVELKYNFYDDVEEDINDDEIWFINKYLKYFTVSDIIFTVYYNLLYDDTLKNLFQLEQMDNVADVLEQVGRYDDIDLLEDLFGGDKRKFTSWLERNNGWKAYVLWTLNL